MHKRSTSQLVGKGDQLAIMQEIRIQPYSQMVSTQTRLCPRNETYRILSDFEIQTDKSIPARRSINKKMRTCKIVDFAVPADHRIKLKECEKKDKYLNLARELKKNYGTCRWQLYQL